MVNLAGVEGGLARAEIAMLWAKPGMRIFFVKCAILRRSGLGVRVLSATDNVAGVIETGDTARTVGTHHPG